MPAEEVNKLLQEADAHMQQTMEALKREYSLIRTGRANPSILDRVMVEYYSENVPIKQVGTIAAPEPRPVLGGLPGLSGVRRFFAARAEGVR